MANSSAAAFLDEIPNKKNKESCIINFPFSPALPSYSIFDMIPPPSQSDDNHHHHQKASSFGYMDLLSTQEFTTSSTLFDWLPTTDDDMQLPPLPVPSPTATSEVLNNPATPVSLSSSISSSSHEAGVANKSVAENEDELGFEEPGDKNGVHGIRLVENQNDQQDQTKKQVKPARKRKNNKQRAPRITFKTRTDVDHMDDGYKWRKYGQKPVKNSPYPRSYYRCTAIGCEVKKRIERSATEASVVLTSYEGNHIHYSPERMRVANFGMMHNPSGFQEQIHQHQNITSGVGDAVVGNQVAMSQYQQYQQFLDQNQNERQQQQPVPSLLYNNDYNNSFNTAPPVSVVNSADNFMDSSASFGGLLQNQVNYGEDNLVRNHGGLLQDMIVPMEMGGARAGVRVGEGTSST
ncbi:WRKY transcription factor [Trifolium pratense]|uniref:WRKY transcription factor n=1 Tax=Trifolium pratense TaxID=57577 RepID=A0A2K3PDB0_TRIPR|nr:WRKY transcription factor [Trifolium pratense]